MITLLASVLAIVGAGVATGTILAFWLTSDPGRFNALKRAWSRTSEVEFGVIALSMLAQALMQLVGLNRVSPREKRRPTALITPPATRLAGWLKVALPKPLFDTVVSQVILDMQQEWSEAGIDGRKSRQLFLRIWIYVWVCSSVVHWIWMRVVEPITKIFRQPPF